MEETGNDTESAAGERFSVAITEQHNTGHMLVKQDDSLKPERVAFAEILSQPDWYLKDAIR